MESRVSSSQSRQRPSTGFSRPPPAPRPATALASSDLRRTFLPPPPEKLQGSALYTTLPEASLHRTPNNVNLHVSQDYSVGDASRLPSRLARQRIQVRPRSAPAFPKPNTFASTTYALQQSKEVEKFKEEYVKKQQAIAEDREQRWDQLRRNIHEKEQVRSNESAQKKKMRLARQMAAKQLKEQHTNERELLSYDERRTRGGVEAYERRERLSHAYGLWKGCLDITFEANRVRMLHVEGVQRRHVMEDYVLDIEARGRAFIQRYYVSAKTNILTAEKADRIALLKLLAARNQWKAQQDAEITGFMAKERRSRQKVFDEEANGFFVIDQSKKDLLAKRDGELRKKAEERLAALRAFEHQQLNDRREFEKLETDTRTGLKNEENSGFTMLKSNAASEKVLAVERTNKRRQQEEREWQVECMRQLQPIVDEETAGREDIESDEISAVRQINALRLQQWDDLLVPIAFSPDGQFPSSKEAPPEPLSSLYRHTGHAMPVFPCAVFKRKVHPSYPTQPLASATMTITTLSGMCVGDDLDINATEVMHTREKSKSSTGLRMIDGAILDEDGATLCTFSRGGLDGSGEFAPTTPEELQSIEAETAVLTAMKDRKDPQITLYFTQVDKEGLTKMVERCVQAVVFKADGISNSTEPRTFQATFSFTYTDLKQTPRRPPPKAATGGSASPLNLSATSSKSAAFSKSLSKSQSFFLPKKEYRLVKTVQLFVGPPLMSLGSSMYTKINLASLTFDVRKRPDGTKMFIPLFPGPVSCNLKDETAVAVDSAGHHSATSGMDFAGGAIKIRWLEGHSPDDLLQFSNSDMFMLRRDELRMESNVVAKMTGKMLPSGNTTSKEVTFTFLDSTPGLVTTGIIERLLGRINYTCTSSMPPTHRRLVEVVFVEPKKGNVVPTTSAIKIEIFMSGTVEQNLSYVADDNTPIVLRDATVSTPEQLHRFLAPNNVWLCHNIALDSHNTLATRDSINSGYVRATVIQGGRQWDRFAVKQPPTAGGAIVSADDGKVYWTAHGQLTEATAGNGTMIGKIRRFSSVEGKLRPGMEVELCDGKLSSLQLLVRSLTFATRSTEASIGCTKTILIEVFIPEPQARKGAAGGNVQYPMRYLVSVKVMPSLLRTDAVSAISKIPRTPNPVPLLDLQLQGDGAEDVVFDGGCLKIQIMDGHSSMEEVILDIDTADDGAAAAGAGGSTTNENSTRGSSPVLEEAPSPQSVSARTAVPEDHAKEPLERKKSMVDTLSLDASKDGSLMLMKGAAVIGTVVNMVDNVPFSITFAGRRRFENRLDFKIDPKAPVLVKGNMAAALLERVCYLHHEQDPLLIKFVRVTLEDTYNRVSQCIMQWDVTPINMPSEFVDVPDEVCYRQGLTNLKADGSLALFEKATITDEDTERCGDGIMSIEPYVGISKGDVLLLTPPPSSSKLRFESSGGNGGGGAGQGDDGSPKERRTVIFHEDEELGLCVDSADGVSNRLKISIRSGTTLDACTALLRQLAFAHRERFPAKTQDRQVLLKFNAGDEDVPDTKAIVTIHVGSPLLYTLPLFEQLTYKEGVEQFKLFPRLLLGLTGTSVLLRGDTLRFYSPNALEEDVFSLLLPENDDFSIEKSCLVYSVNAARQATGKLAIPSPGLSGVRLGTYERQGKSGNGGFTIVFDDSCEVPAMILISALANRIAYHNTSLGPSTMTRDVRLEWHRNETGEDARLAVKLAVESSDDMTEVNFHSTILSCFEGERCMLGENATVSDTDTDSFNEGSILICEVVGGSATDTISFSRTQNKILVIGDRLLYNGNEVGYFDEVSSKRRLYINFLACPLPVVEALVQNLVYSTDRLLGEKSKLVQLTLRGGPDVTPTIATLQVNVHRRFVDVTNCSPAPVYQLGQQQGPLHLFQDIAMSTSENFGGSNLTVALVQSTPSHQGRPIAPGVDKLVFHKVPDHITMSKGAVSAKSGGMLAMQETDGTSFTMSFPKVVKPPMVLLARELLSCLAFETADGDSGLNKSGRAGKKSKQSFLLSTEDSTMVSPKPGSSDAGVVCCCLTLTVPLVDGGNMTSHDYITVIVG